MHYGRYDFCNVTSVMHYGRYDFCNVTSVMHYGRYDFWQCNVRNALRNHYGRHYGRYAPGAMRPAAQSVCAEMCCALA